jgi:hypothetical protein
LAKQLSPEAEHSQQSPACIVGGTVGVIVGVWVIVGVGVAVNVGVNVAHPWLMHVALSTMLKLSHAPVVKQSMPNCEHWQHWFGPSVGGGVSVGVGVAVGVAV